jgi:magnesium transporter
MNPTAQLLEPEIRELIREGLYTELREALHLLPAADVAEILQELDPVQAAVGFRFMHRDDAAEAFAYLSPEKQEALIGSLGAEASVKMVEAMSADDRARLLDELPESVAQRLIGSLTPDTRKETQAILGYPPRSVGRLMTPDYVRVKADWTIGQALDHIRRYGRDAETVNVVYVVDEAGKLVDDLRLRQVLLARPEDSLESIMNRQFVGLRADQPQEEAVDLLQRYDRVALPVVDSRGVLLGIVTHDDVADVAQQEATEDMQRLGGVSALEEPFMTASVGSLVKKRLPWLALLFMSELLTSNAIAFFEDEIKRAAILAAFVPAIISSGGNSGSQSSTLVIRALGLREIELSDWLRVLLRELVVAGLLGLVIGSMGLVRIHIFGWAGWFRDAEVREHYSILGVTIAVTLVGVVLWGSVMGAMLPFLLKRMRLDPAASSTPFVATLVDVTGIVLYFSCAMFILRSTLLSPRVAEAPIRTSVEASVLSVIADGDGWDLRVTLPAGGEARVRVAADAVEGKPEPGERLRFDLEAERATRAERVK